MLLNFIRQVGEKLSGGSYKPLQQYYVEEHIMCTIYPFRIIDRVTGEVVKSYYHAKQAVKFCRRLNKYGKVRIIET